ncbi:hypothetical protein [Paraburkholderia youngii]|uniref:Uncharacterized protein n=1 Tax=Paraburkholderia youngii TaxID=2782701 RepID=A0ABX2NZ38_9BURK|nr:hypothetical protein [Paraburkholderia youngii]NVI09253.1 hypothetical protein [Paraburkholderia youngii]
MLDFSFLAEFFGSQMAEMSLGQRRAGYQEFQGSQVANIPELPGLYAWYYRPAAVNRNVTVKTLARFFSPQTSVRTVVHQRYGMQLSCKATGEILLGSDEQPVSAALTSAFDTAEPFMQWFFRSPQFVQFSRPVYIGIAKNLYDRVYNQHYLALTQYWDDKHRVSRFISANADSSVQDVMDNLDLPHSFALEARVRGITSTDLMVSVLPTDDMPPGIGPDSAQSESSARRSLERFLQLLSDPICGRR